MRSSLLLKCCLPAAVPLIVVAAATAQTPPKGAGAAWTGRWYVGNANVCRSKGQAQGLVVYIANAVQAYEGRCDIKKVTPRGAGVDLLQTCRGEGETWTETEYLEVADGKLKLTTQVEGKRRTFTYNRCPDR
jgi:hypothetical protein